MIGDTIRAIIDLLMLRKTEKKLDAEIAKAPLGVCRAFPATAIERWLGQLRQCQRTPIA